MDPVQYYVATLTKAAMKIGPLLAFLIGGYFIFFKLPFLFLMRNMKNQKSQLQENNKPVLPEEKYGVKDYERFVSRMKKLESNKEEIRNEKEKNGRKGNKRQNQRQQSDQEQRSSHKKTTIDPSSEALLFNFKSGEVITKEELRKRYYELLRQNHPDKVAALSPDFKKLADKKTKEINSAYDKLKKQAV